MTRAEVWGAFFNHDDTEDHDVVDSITYGNGGQPDDFIDAEALFLGRYLNYNLKSDSGLEDSGL